MNLTHHSLSLAALLNSASESWNTYKYPQVLSLQCFMIHFKHSPVTICHSFIILSIVPNGDTPKEVTYFHESSLSKFTNLGYFATLDYWRIQVSYWSTFYVVFWWRYLKMAKIVSGTSFFFFFIIHQSYFSISYSYHCLPVICLRSAWTPSPVILWIQAWAQVVTALSM